jgi:uncharacterized membrane protein
MENVELPPVVLPPSPRADSDDQERSARLRRRQRLRNIAVIFLTVIVLYALVSVWSRWGQFNPKLGSSARAAAGIPINPKQHPWYFPMLLMHVITASLTLPTCVLQLWPWLRREHPRIHRIVGRVYIFGGVWPATVFGLIVEAFWPFSIETAFQQVFLALLWTAVTTYGFVLIRRGEYARHRRYMIRSFALTFSVMVETALGYPVSWIMAIGYHSELGGNKYIFQQASASTDNWLGMVVTIIAVEWWLERDQLRRAARRQVLQPRAAGRAMESAAGPMDSADDVYGSTVAPR